MCPSPPKLSSHPGCHTTGQSSPELDCSVLVGKIRREDSCLSVRLIKSLEFIIPGLIARRKLTSRKSTLLTRSIRDQSQRANCSPPHPKLELYRQIQRVTVYWSRGTRAETSMATSTRFLLPSASYPAFSKKLQDILKDTKHNLKRQSKYQNQTQIWQRCWNYQTGNLKQLWLIG